MAVTSPLVVACWAGSDIKELKEISEVNKFWRDQLSNPKIKHIAISHWIAEDLDILGFKYKYIPITPHDINEIEPCKLGDSVYMYNPGNDIYNGGIYQKIKEVLPYKFIEAKHNTYSREQLMEVYKNSFIGLRFTEHDGLSNTVCEMGAMGRMMIHNGDTPNCIKYDKNNIDEIIDTIHTEYKYSQIADKTETVSSAVNEFLNIGDDWLNTEYYD